MLKLILKTFTQSKSLQCHLDKKYKVSWFLQNWSINLWVNIFMLWLNIKVYLTASSSALCKHNLSVMSHFLELQLDAHKYVFVTGIGYWALTTGRWNKLLGQVRYEDVPIEPQAFKVWTSHLSVNKLEIMFNWNLIRLWIKNGDWPHMESNSPSLQGDSQSCKYPIPAYF